MTDYRARARQIALEEGVDPDLFEKLVGAESSFNPNARSSAGAIGLAQLMPGTAGDMGVDINDPDQNLRGGARYLKQMQDKFRSTPMALAAYNAGPGRVSKAGGVPNIPETEAYVAKINARDDDSDIFGDPAPTAAPAPAEQPSIRRGADGAIEIDINQSTNPEFVAQRAAQNADFGDDADIFSSPAAMEAPAMATAMAAAKVEEPYNLGPLGEAGKAFGGAAKKLGADLKGAFDAQQEELKPQNALDRLKSIPGRTIGGMGRTAGIVADVAALGLAPINGLVQGGLVKPAAELLANLPAGYKPTTFDDVATAFKTGEGVKPTRMTKAESRDAFADALNMGLSALKPGEVTLPKLPARTDLRVAQALERAATRDQTTLADVASMARATPEVPAFQAGGENMMGLTEVAAQSPGAASSIITKAVRDDKAAASHRIKDEIGKGLGGKGDYFATLDKVVAKRAADAKNGIAVIEQAPVSLDNSSVVALRSDLAKGAIRDAAQNALASPDEAVRNSGAQLARLADEVLDQPGQVEITVRAAQDISKSLLDAADAAYKGGNGARGKALKDLGRAVRDNAQDPAKGGVKEYGDWLKAYGDESDHIEALELGRDVLSGKRDVSAERLRKTVGEMSQTSLDNFRKGVGEAILNEARTKGSVNAMRQALKEEIGDRVRIAFPDEAGYKAFMDAAELEVQREAKNNRVLNNSRTFGRGAAADDLKAQGVDGADVASAAADLFSLNIGSMSGKALKAALKNLPRKDRSILGDPVTNEVLGRALADPDEMTRLLNALEVVKARRAAPLSQRIGAATSKAIPLVTTSQSTAQPRN